MFIYEYKHLLNEYNSMQRLYIIGCIEMNLKPNPERIKELSGTKIN